MIKKIIKKITGHKIVARLLLKPALLAHSLSYQLADYFAIVLGSGVHPKHRIIKYAEWFSHKIEPGCVVLDIGSHAGAVSEFLADKAGFVYAVEIRHDLIEQAKLGARKKNIEYICGDATKLDFSGLKHINYVLLSNVLEHIEDRVSFLKRLINCLNWQDQSRKLFLFRVPMLERDWIVFYKKELGLKFMSDETHAIEYTFQGLQNELSDSGIKIIEHEIKFGEIYAVGIAINR